MLSYKNITIFMAPPEICSLCKVMFYLPGLGGGLRSLFDEWEMHPYGMEYGMESLMMVSLFFLALGLDSQYRVCKPQVMQCDLGVSYRQLGLNNEIIGDDFRVKLEGPEPK